MRRKTRRVMVVTFAFGVAAAVSVRRGVRGQDPDRWICWLRRNLVAHRPSVPGVHGLVTAGHPPAGDGRSAGVDEGWQRHGCGGGGRHHPEHDGTADERHRREWFHDRLRQEERQAVLAFDGGCGAEGIEGVLRDDLRVAELGHQCRDRAGKHRRLPHWPAAVRDDEPGRHVLRLPSTTPTTGIRSTRRLRRRSPGRRRGSSESPTTAKVFVPNGKTPAAGENWKNTDLAATLEEADRRGAERSSRLESLARRRSTRPSIASTKATSRRSSIASSRPSTAT